MRRHCLNGRVQILPAECMIRRIDREVEQICVPYAVKTAALGDKPAMQRYYFISLDTLYANQFANALNAAMCLSSISLPAVITSSTEASTNSAASVSVIGVKVSIVLPVGTSGGTSMVNLWFAGISTVCVMLIE
jgi:hypothetical protein